MPLSTLQAILETLSQSLDWRKNTLPSQLITWPTLRKL